MSKIWLWEDKRFVAGQANPTFCESVVSLGWCKTKSSAQKAIKRGEVRWRKVPEDWNVVKDYRDYIPTGWPIVINFQRKPWLFREVMVPVAEQGIRQWTRIWLEKPIRAWDTFLDRL